MIILALTVWGCEKPRVEQTKIKQIVSLQSGGIILPVRADTVWYKKELLGCDFHYRILKNEDIGYGGTLNFDKGNSLESISIFLDINKQKTIFQNSSEKVEARCQENAEPQIELIRVGAQA